MDLKENVASPDRLVRTVLIAGLAVAAVRSFRRGRRVIGLLAAAGIAVLGYTATTESDDLTEAAGIESTSDDGKLRCAICGEVIVAGQPRVPNEDDETVHETCLEAVA